METNKFIRPLFFVLCLTLCMEVNIYSQEIKAGEYKLKAAFLFNFLKFVDWSNGDISRDSPYTICVLGEDPFGPELRYLQNKTVGEKKVKVRLCKNLGEIKNCHILFVCSSEKENLGRILANLGNAKILTVGDMDGFVQAGGIIQFTLKENRLRFIVNIDAANRAKLKISSKLLKLAQSFRG